MVWFQSCNNNVLVEMKMLTLIMYGNFCQGNCPNLHKSSEKRSQWECTASVLMRQKNLLSKKNLHQFLNSYWHHVLIQYWLTKYFYYNIVCNVMCYSLVYIRVIQILANLCMYELNAWIMITNKVTSLDLQWN